MSHGGRRANAGRKVLAKSKLDRVAREQAMAGGITPLEYMLNILRGGDEVTAAERMDAAKAAAPYVHARLAHIEQQTEVKISFVARLPSPAASVEEWQEDRKLRLLASH